MCHLCNVLCFPNVACTRLDIAILFCAYLNVLTMCGINEKAKAGEIKATVAKKLRQALPMPSHITHSKYWL